MGINFKQFEILVKSYRFSKYERKLLNEPKWRHKKHYYTFWVILETLRKKNLRLNDEGEFEKN